MQFSDANPFLPVPSPTVGNWTLGGLAATKFPSFVSETSAAASIWLYSLCHAKIDIAFHSRFHTIICCYKLELSSSLLLCLCEFPFMVIRFLCGLCVLFYLGRIKTQVFSRIGKMLCKWCQNLHDLVTTMEVHEKGLAFRILYFIVTNRAWPMLSLIKDSN